jgi:hypothetical protein
LYLIAVVLLLAAMVVVACSSDETTVEDDAQMAEGTMDNSNEMEEMGEMPMDEVDETGSAGEMGDMTMGGAPEGLDTSTDRMTDEGLFHVSISSNLEPLVLNEIHSWTVHVETADGQPVENAQISVDGGMPEHNHGFPTTPEITEELGGGDYLLEGVKFSMAGWWELKLNIDDGDQADRITFNLVLP